jgi:hypothetical protein
VRLQLPPLTHGQVGKISRHVLTSLLKERKSTVNSHVIERRLSALLTQLRWTQGNLYYRVVKTVLSTSALSLAAAICTKCVQSYSPLLSFFIYVLYLKLCNSEMEALKLDYCRALTYELVIYYVTNERVVFCFSTDSILIRMWSVVSMYNGMRSNVWRYVRFLSFLDVQMSV